MLTYLMLVLFIVECEATWELYVNVTRTTLPGLALHRSSLTLDWLAVEDARQRAMIDMYEPGDPPLLTKCHENPAPSPRKVGRYILEMLRKLEGENGVVIKEFIQTLIDSKILVEVLSYESEPDLQSLVKTPEVLRTEPHTTFPRIMALVWMVVTDPVNVDKNGWCSIDKVTQFLRTVEAGDTSGHLKTLSIVIGKARLVMENFIQQFSALNIIYQSRKPVKLVQKEITTTTTQISTTIVQEEITSTIPPRAVRYETVMRCSGDSIFTTITTLMSLSVCNLIILFVE